MARARPQGMPANRPQGMPVNRPRAQSRPQAMPSLMDGARASAAAFCLSRRFFFWPRFLLMAESPLQNQRKLPSKALPPAPQALPSKALPPAPQKQTAKAPLQNQRSLPAKAPLPPRRIQKHQENCPLKACLMTGLWRRAGKGLAFLAAR